MGNAPTKHTGETAGAPDYEPVLENYRAARARITIEAPDEVIATALDEITKQLGQVIAPLAAFVNQLDDGTGVSNTTMEFAQALVGSLSALHQYTFAMSVVDTLSVEHRRQLVMYAQLLDGAAGEEGA